LYNQIEENVNSGFCGLAQKVKRGNEDILSKMMLD
jgi:hypothetical protein